ncbi:MAG: sigma-54-dependent Fis family transcriptional regulator [Gammaproteobacteria bacterium]|nr:sigma-54-dependent Fis family transcriptional regulator [Gammaproteobacteria bacterium]
MKPYILVVDDEPDIRDLVRDILQDENYEVDIAEDGNAARISVQTRRPDLILLDIWMPDIDGISLLKEFVESGLTSPVVMISGHGNVETAVEATRLGAYDFIEKPLSLGKLLMTVQRVLDSAGHSKDSQFSGKQSSSSAYTPIGKSVVMQNFREQVKRVAGFDNWVMFCGESGTGKELYARYLHSNCKNTQGPFVNVRVSSIIEDNPEELLFGSEKDGHVETGFLEQADGGILFLNDIADLDLSTQAKLLDVFITRSLKRIGGHERKEIDIRIVAGTRVDLQEAIKAGRFRDDLFYRLNEIPLYISPLREHREDIPDFVHHFVDLFVNEANLPYRKFSMAAQNWLRNYNWPGNVLELRNLVQRLLMMGDGNEISVAEVEAAVMLQSPSQGFEMPADFSLPLRQARERFEKTYLEYHLQEAGGNVGMVAKQAGMERTHLYRKFRALDIDPKKTK